MDRLLLRNRIVPVLLAACFGLLSLCGCSPADKAFWSGMTIKENDRCEDCDRTPRPASPPTWQYNPIDDPDQVQPLKVEPGEVLATGAKMGVEIGAEVPVMNVPPELRQRNWGGGSCVHASTVHLLRWQGLYELADWWRANHGGGEYSSRLNRKMEAAGLRYAYTTSGDVPFLEWCIRTRRGAGIGYKPSHAINLVHLDQQRAGLLDNNHTSEFEWVPRETFIRNWQRRYGGWAWTLVYDPPPPVPFLADASVRERLVVR